MLLPSVSASWYQDGHDPARTGIDEGAGPLTDDLAFQVRFPAFLFSPRVFNGYVYVQGGAVPNTDPNAVESGVWRVSLADAQVEKIIELDELPYGTTADEERLYVAVRREMRAYTHDGTLLWATPWPRPNGGEDAGCDNALQAVVEVTIYVACGLVETVGGTTLPRDAVVIAYELATGTQLATWRASQERPRLDPTGVDPAREAATTTPRATLTPAFFAVSGDRVLISVGEMATTQEGTRFLPPVPEVEYQTLGVGRYTLYALDAVGLTFVWEYEESRGRTAVSVPDTDVRVEGERATIVGQPSVIGDIAYVPAQQLYAMNPVTGIVVWAAEIGEADPIDGGGMAVAGTPEALFTASYQSIYRVDPTAASEVWRRTLADAEPKRWGSQPIVLAGEYIYARAEVVNEENQRLPFDVIYCYDLDGQLVWQRRVARLDPPREIIQAGFRLAISDGVLVLAGQDGTVRVFGNTPASIALEPHATTLYPALGETFGIELSDVAPGAFGPATEWRAEWGDGNVTEWTTNPVLLHAYAREGDVTARLQARNAANQTTSSFVVFHVGAQAPVPLTPLQRAFAPEFQNWTFFILGTVATAIGGAVGFYRIRAKRRVLQRELRGLDQDYARLKDKPVECEAMLAERRVKARGLLISGKFEESHFAVLDLRITELGRGLRLAVLDARFDHLPHGMVKTIREMLEDGRIGRVEREHFVTLLERDLLLAPDQKERIRALVDEWFARDDAGTTARSP